MAFLRFAVFMVVLAIYLDEVYGHGYMFDPINRSSAWRKGFKTPPNYTDNEHFCGGVSIQYQRNGGKCGVCGDNYAVSRPRPNENGGTFGTGTIVKEYKAGSNIDITVRLTASHLGYFQFALCPLRSPKQLETEECFDKYPLKLVDGSDKYYVPTFGNKDHVIPVVLPKGVTCNQCVIRWHYRVGNSWGNCGNGTSAKGCGNQETFRSCADVKIVA